MHRTQLYLDDSLWEALRSLARSRKTTVSELVRQAARDRYLKDDERRRRAMQAFVGSTPRLAGHVDSTEYVRGLRRSKRLDRLNKQ